MATHPKHNQRFFVTCGRLGGKKRAARLSAAKRSSIAAHAARNRWQQQPNDGFMPSVRFATPQLDNPAYLEEVLLDGSLDAWRQLYKIISDQPFGGTAVALEKVLTSTSAYGITPLWKGILRNVQEYTYE